MVNAVTSDDIKQLAVELKLTLNYEEITQYVELASRSLALYQELEDMPEEPAQSHNDRSYYYPKKNLYNAWQCCSDISISHNGKLLGKTVAIKDNICVANLPMHNGSSSLQGYIPEIDATVVTRLLKEGAIIKGKANCEYLCLSGGSHACVTGPVKNPHKLTYSAGGSSSGSAALVSANLVDVSIGADQGGSVRIPASFCGAYGMKPTYGLVPYTGAMPIELTLDTIGIFSNNVIDNAKTLQVIAGKDSLDPRQTDIEVRDYQLDLEKGVKSVRIGVLTEGFAWDNSKVEVDVKTRQAANILFEQGAVVEGVSVPMHRQALSIWQAIALEGSLSMMMEGNGYGNNWKGFYLNSLMDKHSNWRSHVNDFSPSLKLSLMMGNYIKKHYQGRFYAKAQNLSRQLNKAYNDALAQYDVLLMPTTPMQATPLPEASASVATSFLRSNEMLSNTAAFNVTGHPALSLPCGMHNELPVGLMLVAKHFDEQMLYRVAHQFEKSVDWKTL